MGSKLRVITVFFNDLYFFLFAIVIYPKFCCQFLMAMNNYEFSLLEYDSVVFLDSTKVMEESATSIFRTD